MAGKGIISAQVTGINEFAGDLARFDRRLRSRVLKRSVTAGAKVFRNELKVRVPVESGLTKKSLGVKSKTYRRSGIHVAIVGPRTGFKREVQIKKKVAGQRKKKVTVMVRDPVKYAHLVELLHPWMRPAFHAKQAEASAVTTRTMRQEIDLAAKANGG